MGFAAAIRRKYINNNAGHSKDDRGGINEVSGRKDLIGNQHQAERAMKRVPRVTQTIWAFGNAINCLISTQVICEVSQIYNDGNHRTKSAQVKIIRHLSY